MYGKFLVEIHKLYVLERYKTSDFRENWLDLPDVGSHMTQDDLWFKILTLRFANSMKY